MSGKRPAPESPKAEAQHKNSRFKPNSPLAPVSADTSDTENVADEQEEPQGPIEPDDANTSNGYESARDDASSIATSLASSIRDYNFENRRRYHKYNEGQYNFPNDEPEQERENMKHHMIVALCDNELHNAPIKGPRKVVDIGTGTGIWAIEMGEKYPEAEIDGLDLSPIQPPFVPPNVSFLVDDVEAEWLYPENSIDYVHLRHMAPSIKDWPKLLCQAYKALKPGGWLELQDIVPEYKCDDATMPPSEQYTPAKTLDLITEGLAHLGVDLRAGNSHAGRIEAAGFRSLMHDIKKVPVGSWPKDAHLKSIGSYAHAMIYDGLHGNTIGSFTRGLGWSPEEVEVFLVQVRKEMTDNAVHPYIFYHSYAA
ncbi:Secondary metabolism regulator LAE1 [Colletotrichum sidae]|uniref:Secondary metabolism regulator LAE1 n=1 Tax=Colletotrichum sidae TaxID=1347389 RepID=A0A4R8T3P9_9PEZI|nr:Secondary metabolism regulator LAE1 [Colletotrichum sidae]